jgi:hypothetical protein
MRKQDSGSVRFGAQDDDGDNDEVSHEHFVSRREDASDQDTE